MRDEEEEKQGSKGKVDRFHDAFEAVTRVGWPIYSETCGLEYDWLKPMCAEYI